MEKGIASRLHGTLRAPLAGRQRWAGDRVLSCSRLMLKEFGNNSSNRTRLAEQAVIGKICLP